VKSKTGIQGLDDITYGGLPDCRPTLVVGSVGSGKTVMGMEFITNGIALYNEPGVFMTFEEKVDELKLNVLSMGHDLEKFIADNKLYLERLHIDQMEIQETGRYNIDGLFIRLGAAIDKVKAKRVVLDSLDTLFTGLDHRILRSEFRRLLFWLKEKKVTAIITAEVGDIFLTRFGLEEIVADCVIELNCRVVNQIATRRLRIVKYRGSHHSLNEYPFIIDLNGITIFPIISEAPQMIVSTERISSGINQIDEMLENKGFYVGSSILVSGSAGTGKTSVASSFAHDACKNNIKVLYCAFEEAPNQIMRNMKTIGLDLQPFVKSGNLYFYYSRPTLQNLELHLISIKKIIKDTNATVVILDPITNIMIEELNSDMRTMLIRFIDYLKMEQITVLLSATVTSSSLELIQSNEGISSMVDTCIMIEEKTINEYHKKFMYIMKSRGINNSKKEYEFIISNDGIRVASKKPEPIETY
jgi:circadian clock protein KaiC